jgi:hypothetical protein
MSGDSIRQAARRNRSVDTRDRSGIRESNPSQTTVEAMLQRRKSTHRRHPVVDAPKGNSS